MNKNNVSIRRWTSSAVYLGVVVVLMACSVLTGAPRTEDGSLRLREGSVEVLDESGEWTPVAGSATFDLAGALESIDPWMVAGTSIETNELTQIADGLQVGDLVRVRGTILEDGTWVAYSIEPVEEQTDPIIILIGVVDSVDPWVVNGIELNVTDETEIQGEIKVGTIVRVEILLLADGTWEVISIAPLGDSTETPGCVTVIARVISVSGDQIQFEGWPLPVSLAEDVQSDKDENGDAETIQPGQEILAVVCINEDGQLVITQLTLLDEDDGEGDGTGNEKVLVCHNASKNNPHTISIAQPAVDAHLAHGDTLGPCP